MADLNERAAVSLKVMLTMAIGGMSNFLAHDNGRDIIRTAFVRWSDDLGPKSQYLLLCDAGAASLREI